jgi:hypothetical protein
MRHPIYRIVECEYVKPFSLRLKFEDGLERLINFHKILKGEIYGPLQDPELFSQVMIDPEVHTITWPNGADFDPAVLHDWPLHEKSFVQAAEGWEKTAALAVA